MGRIRGKRNRDQDRYWHVRRKATQAGMVAASGAALCANCKLVAAASEMFHGWCQKCMTTWRATANPVMIAQAAAGYAPHKCLPGPSEKEVSQILEVIVTPKDDKEFLPLLLFLGNGTVGRMQSLWNFCKTMELTEMKTTGEVFRLTKASHDLVHRCGLHAPVQRTTLDGFFSRVFHAENFKPIQRDKHLLEYMRWFADANRMLVFPRGRISAISEWKTRREWRKFPRLAYRHLTDVWPFLHKEAANDHLDIMLVDSLVPKGIPEQWRQDMCQDLFVAVLSGEIEPDRLSADSRYYIKKIWRQHPYKYYGTFPLDAPIKQGGSNGTYTLNDVLPDLSLDHPSSHYCHDGHQFDVEPEPRSLSTLGDLLRDKNNGVAIPDLRIDHPREMDEEVFEVYRDEIYRKRPL